MVQDKKEKLTPAEEALLPEWRQRWWEIGTSTAPAERGRAERAIALMYAATDRPPPRVLWVDSPMQAQLAIHLLGPLGGSLEDSLGNSLGDSLWDSLWVSLGSSLGNSLGRGLDDSLGDSLGNSLRRSLVDSLGHSLWVSLVHSLGISLGLSLGASLRDSLGHSLRIGLGDSLVHSLGANLRDSLGHSLRIGLGHSLGNSLGNSLGRSLRHSLRHSLRYSLRHSLRRSLGNSLEVSLWDSLGGSLEVSLWDSLWHSLRRSLWDSLVHSLGRSLVHSLGNSLRYSLRHSLGNSLGHSLENSLWLSLRHSLGDSLRHGLRDSLGNSLGGSLRDSLGHSLRVGLGRSLWDSLGHSLGHSKGTKYEPTNFWGGQDAHWLSFYTFAKDIGVQYEPRDQAKLNIMSEYAQSAGWLWPYQGAAIVSERPTEINWNNDNTQLHKDGGAAVKFRDGWGVYALNGVVVPQWLAEKPHREIPAKKFAEIENVEVRREFVRKVGIERIALELGGKVLDKSGDYELLAVDLGEEVGTWPYLKMLNPSIGCWHLECVSQECGSVQEAINFRASNLKALKGDWKPEVLT